MIEKSRGIIFKTVKYGESSLIAEVFTDKLGIRSFIISGVRKPKSRISAALVQIGALVDMVFYYHEDKNIHRLKELNHSYIFRDIPFNFLKGAITLFISEVSRKCIGGSEAHSELFEYVCGSIQALDNSKQSVANFPIVFLAGLSGHLGFFPHGTFSEVNPVFDLREGIYVSALGSDIYTLETSMSKQFSITGQLNFSNCHEFNISQEVRRKLLKTWIDYFKIHIEGLREINSHIILEKVLSN